MQIRPYQPADETAVIALWQACELTRPWNDPRKDIARKLGVQAQWFVVGELPEAQGAPQLVACAMAGYDGHRGWVNYLAVHPAQRRQGLASALMAHLEAELTAAGCPKLNLQIRQGNEAVVGFYQALGYAVDPVVSMGKRLIAD